MSTIAKKDTQNDLLEKIKKGYRVTDRQGTKFEGTVDEVRGSIHYQNYQ